MKRAFENIVLKNHIQVVTPKKKKPYGYSNTPLRTHE